MSKLTKLINNPTLFFTDSIEKRKRQIITRSEEFLGVSISKPSAKPSAKPNFLISKEINIFTNYLILHTGEKYFSSSHVKLWYSHFLQSEVSFIIVTRYIEAYNDILNDYPEAIVILAKNKEDIDILFNSVTSIEACFYMSNTGNNSHLLYHTNSKHIFIGHGDSDKSASAHKYFRAYDENWVAGQAHIDRFENAGFELNGLKQVKVGRPSLLNIIKKSQLNWKHRFGMDYKLLYLPTWEGTYKEQDYSSLSIVAELLLEINNIDNINTSIKLHPFTGRREIQFADLEKDIQEMQIERINVIDKSESLSDYIQNSNIFICDISAVVSECLAANAPIFLYIPKDKEFNLSKSNIDYSEYCYIFSSVEELVSLLKDVLFSENDFLVDNRKIAADYIISTDITLDNEFVRRLKGLGVANA